MSNIRALYLAFDSSFSKRIYFANNLVTGPSLERKLLFTQSRNCLFYGRRWFTAASTKAHYLSPILRQTNPLHIFTRYSSIIHCCNIIPSVFPRLTTRILNALISLSVLHVPPISTFLIYSF